MTHYEQRLEKDLTRIRDRVDALGKDIERAVASSVRALLGGDRTLASETILGDHPINRETREIDRLCHAFVARHLPSAGHLRFVSSVMRLNIELERIGDYAVTIARESVQLTAPPPDDLVRDVEMMGEQTQAMLRQAMLAFHERNAELARGTKAMADQVDAAFDRVFADLIQEGEAGSRPIQDLFALLIVLNRLERISDQAKNICEETVFAATGETKAPKVYKVLFIDAANNGLSQMAAAHAARAFPESGRYDSAGWAPAAELDAAAASFMDGHGLDVSELSPKPLDLSPDVLGHYHVIVGLEDKARDRVLEVPYHTVVVEWPLGPVAEAADLKPVYEELTLRIRDLMETLRGEGAA